MGLQSTNTATILPDDVYSELSSKGQLPIAAVCQTQNNITYVTSIALFSVAIGISVFMIAQQFNTRTKRSAF